MKALIFILTVLLSVTVFAQSASKTLTIGPKTNDNKELRFNRNSSTPPRIRWNEAATKIQFTNDGVTYKDIGSGGGGGAAGINALAEADRNPNFEDGITTNWSCTASTCTAVTSGNNLLEGTVSIAFDATAASQVLSSTALTVPAGLRGTACEGKIRYKGGDSNLALRVINGDDEVLGSFTLMASPIPTDESVFFLCPTQAQIDGDADKGNLRLQVVSTADAAVIYVDRTYWGSLANLAETTLPDSFSAKISSAGVVSDENVDWINGNASIAATSQYTLTFNSGIFSAVPNCVATPVSNTESMTINEFTAVTTTGGTWLTRRTDTTVAIAKDWRLVCKKSTDAKQAVQVYKSIPKSSDNLNSFTAYVNAGGSTGGESVEWINGNCTNANPSVCTFNTNLFSIAPQCLCSLYGSSAGSCVVEDVTSSAVSIQTYNSSWVESNATLPRFFMCARQGADVKTPVVQPILFPQGTEYTTVTSSIKTPAGSGQYMAMTGNSITVPSGQEWELNGTVTFLNSGASPGYTSYYVDFFAANGADSGVQPTNITPLSGLATTQLEALSAQTVLRVTTGTIRVSAGTYYLVPFAGMSTPANARVTAYINGKRLK